jgi:hypothetical protein
VCHIELRRLLATLIVLHPLLPVRLIPIGQQLWPLWSGSTPKKMDMHAHDLAESVRPGVPRLAPCTTKSRSGLPASSPGQRVYLVYLNADSA